MDDLFSKILSVSYTEYKDNLTNYLKSNTKKLVITANSETFVIASNDKEFKKIILDKQTDLIADGISLVKMSKRYNKNITERIPGVEMAEHLINECNTLNKSIYLFGAKEEVIKTLVEKIKEKYPNINILGYKNGYDHDRDEVFEEIAKLKPDLCLVALGIPHQEKIIYKHLNKFDKGVFMGVGGTFDVLSGLKKRAPKIFIKLNLEWFYRVITDPKRIKRFIKQNIFFLKTTLKKKKD